MPFLTPTVAPKRLMLSLWRQPQDWICPLVSMFVTTLFSLPQSQRQRQYTRLGFVFSLSISNATSRPNRCPVKSLRRAIPLRQPQDTLCHLPRVSVDDSRLTTLPQSQRHNQTPCPLSDDTRSITVSEPKRCPVKSLYSNRSTLGGLGFAHLRWSKQPQLLVCPNRNLAAVTVVSLPQSQRQSHQAPPLPLCEYRSATSLPNRCPVKSTYGPIGRRCPQPQLSVLPDFRLRESTVVVSPQSHLHSHEILPGRDERRITTSFPNLWPTKSISGGMYRSNNNAASASHVMLSRQHVMHRRRGYQYNTCACCLDKFHYSMEGQI